MLYRGALSGVEARRPEREAAALLLAAAEGGLPAEVEVAGRLDGERSPVADLPAEASPFLCPRGDMDADRALELPLMTPAVAGRWRPAPVPRRFPGAGGLAAAGDGGFGGTAVAGLFATVDPRGGDFAGAGWT